MRILVRNMVCRNCVSNLQRMLEGLGFLVSSVGLGYAEVETESLSEEQLRLIDEGLQSLGFERITDRRTRIVEDIKRVIISHVNAENPCRRTLSCCIEDAVGQDYKTASRMFSSIEGRTVEKYYVAAKIEKAKELLSYGDVTLSDIAWRLGYSSTAFLSRQFKQETGMTPTQYQRSQHERRALNEI